MSDQYLSSIMLGALNGTLNVLRLIKPIFESFSNMLALK